MIRLRLFAAISLALLPLLLSSPAAAEEQESSYVSEVTTIVTPGGDDMSYQIPLLAPVMFCDVEYDAIFATTNAVITFGQPDGTFWDYPQTPSISLGSQDWVAFPQRGDEHFIISYTDNAFQIDMSVRPFGANTDVGTSRLLLSGTINEDRSITFAYYLENVEAYANLRYGVRTPTGEILSLEEAGFYEVAEPPSEAGELIVAPTPEPTPEPSPSEPEPTPTPVETETPSPTQTPLPTPIPSEPAPVEPIVPPTTPVAPEPETSQEPQPQPETQPQPQETSPPVQPTPEPVTPSPAPSPEPIPPVVEPEVKPITSVAELPVVISPAQLMQIDLTQIVATDMTVAQSDALVEAALETFETAEQGSPEYQQALDTLFLAAQQDDIVLDEALAAIPLLGDVLGGAVELVNFLGNAGSDMSPEVRETSEKIVVTAVIVTQIVGVSAFAAMASTSRQ